MNQKFEGAPSEFLDAAAMQAEHDFEFGMQAANYRIGGRFPIGSTGDGIARRRGTGPKARMQAFLNAFDAWDRFVDYHGGDFDACTYEELGQLAILEAEMHKARAGVTTKLGL